MVDSNSLLFHRVYSPLVYHIDGWSLGSRLVGSFINIYFGVILATDGRLIQLLVHHDSPETMPWLKPAVISWGGEAARDWLGNVRSWQPAILALLWAPHQAPAWNPNCFHKLWWRLKKPWPRVPNNSREVGGDDDGEAGGGGAANHTSLYTQDCWIWFWSSIGHSETIVWVKLGKYIRTGTYT